MKLTAGDIMTPLSECVSEDDTLREAARRLLDLRFGGAPIISSDHRVSAFLHSNQLLMTLLDGRDAGRIRVRDVSAIDRRDLTQSDFSVRADEAVEDVEKEMAATGAAFALVKERDALLGIVAPEDITSYTYSAPDGLPLPPPRLINLVGPPRRRGLWQRFYNGGERAAERFRDILRQHDTDIAALDAVLDFGCGCGRVIRHWKDPGRSRLCGSDYNPSLIEWCRHNLPFAEFEVNALTPPLPFEDEAFDLVYSLSVFTHLDGPLQKPWITELQRITKPEGLLLLTLQGTSFVSRLDPDQQRSFRAGELVVVRPDLSGMNQCSVFHPERYIHETLGRSLKVVAIEPGRPPIQDAVLFRNI